MGAVVIGDVLVIEACAGTRSDHAALAAAVDGDPATAVTQPQ
jgi:hypothetical protein